MATKAKPLPQDIGKVRIPAKYLTSLDDFLTSLHNPILEAAAARAFARKSGPTAGRVNADDIVQAARRMLPSALTDLAECLQSCETIHSKSGRPWY